MIRRVLLAAGAAGAWLAAPLTAQSPSPFAVTTQPATLTRGTVGLITVRAAGEETPPSLAGRAADEPLHFHPAPSGGLNALIGVPIEGPDSLVVTLFPAGPAGGDSVTVTLRVNGGVYRSERLEVATKAIAHQLILAQKIDPSAFPALQLALVPATFPNATKLLFAIAQTTLEHQNRFFEIERGRAL